MIAVIGVAMHGVALRGVSKAMDAIVNNEFRLSQRAVFGWLVVLLNTVIKPVKKMSSPNTDCGLAQ